MESREPSVDGELVSRVGTIVTVLAVLVSIEYSNERYDQWDVLVASLAALGLLELRAAWRDWTTRLFLAVGVGACLSVYVGFLVRIVCGDQLLATWERSLGMILETPEAWSERLLAQLFGSPSFLVTAVAASAVLVTGWVSPNKDGGDNGGSS